MSGLNGNLEVIEAALLGALKDGEIASTYEWAGEAGFDHDAVENVIKSLRSDEYIEFSAAPLLSWVVTEAGNTVLSSGSPEYNVLLTVIERAAAGDPVGMKDKSAFESQAKGKAMKAKWIKVDKAAGVLVACADPAAEDFVDATKESVAAIFTSGGGDGGVAAKELKDLKKRGFVDQVKTASFNVTRGSAYAPVRVKAATDLTEEMLASGEWESASFKSLNFNAKGLALTGGYLHPLLKTRTQFREIFLELGFEEMPTNNFVESSFWNFDTLFQPQQHPARDAHDTFFISDPAATLTWPEEYAQVVKKQHEVGGFGSIGHRYDWSEDEARKNIMRTHTTAVSSRMLYLLAQEEVFTPKKYFSIDRVFRNETLDSTHLAEFHQVEGLIADYDVTLGDLIGVLNSFFRKLGINKLRFKPAYNPYTEPSMEIFSWHEASGKWLEVGNSGVFRPEMLRPMGLPDNVGVIAWGLSLERPTMITYGISNIRRLFGHSVDLSFIRSASICDITLERTPASQVEEEDAAAASA